MCRLLGISYGDTANEDLTTSQIASVLFRALVHGGPHAYGWMSYNEDANEIRYAKSPGRADHPEAQQWVLSEVDDDAAWWAGHVRYATNGDPEDNRNNHPIWHGNICGVHNGVLRDWEPILEETGREDEKSEVDSEAIFAAVNKWGNMKGLAKVYGAAVAIYTDIRNPHLLYLGRTKGRSITLGWTDRGNMIWASEESALLELEKFGIFFTRFSKVSENRLLTISRGSIRRRRSFRDPEPKVSTIGRAVPNWDRGLSDEEWEKEMDNWFKDLSNPPAKPKEEEDFYSDMQVLKAQRRGRKMAKAKIRKKEAKETAKTENEIAHDGFINKLRDESGERQLVFYQGQFITTDEYAEIMTGSR